MKDLMSYGVRSVVLTSGTLSPLASFRAEMQMYDVPFIPLHRFIPIFLLPFCREF